MAKINFRTCLSGDSKDFSSESGSKYLDQYEYDFDDKGEVKRTTLHKTDKPINVYARIQADYESCDINAIMRRFALGDSSVLDVKSGFYADVTKMPKTLAEVFARNVEAQRVFDHLPADVKELFDNSYEEFWTEYGSDEFLDKIDQYNDRFVDHSFDVEDVVKEDVADE